MNFEWQRDYSGFSGDDAIPDATVSPGTEENGKSLRELPQLCAESLGICYCISGFIMTFRDGINMCFICEETQQERIVLYLWQDPLRERESPENLKNLNVFVSGSETGVFRSLILERV